MYLIWFSVLLQERFAGTKAKSISCLETEWSHTQNILKHIDKLFKLLSTLSREPQFESLK
jgi:hypothetical protein